MRVVVAALSDDCPAARAVRVEGVPAEVVCLADELDYSRLLERYWNEGETFVLLEHDVVPWPGALEELHRCEQPWCVHEYPQGPGHVRWALGCTKISGEIAKRAPSLTEEWWGVPWNQLDAAFVRAVMTLVPRPHIHQPAFAHVK